MTVSNTTLVTCVVDRSDVPDSALVCDDLRSFGHAVGQLKADPFADPVAINYDGNSYLVITRQSSVVSQQIKTLLNDIVFEFAHDTSVRTFMRLKRRLYEVVRDEHERARLNDALVNYVSSVDDGADNATRQDCLDAIELILVRGNRA